MVHLPIFPLVFLLLLLLSVEKLSGSRTHLDELLQNRSYDTRVRPFEDEGELLCAKCRTYTSLPLANFGAEVMILYIRAG